MGLMAKSNDDETNFVLTPEGLHHAICYSVYDLGTHYNDKFGKKEHRVLIMWELPKVRIEIVKEEGAVDLPKAISKKYTLSLGEKANLRKDLQGWRGKSFTKQELKGFSLEKLIAVNCQLQVIHNTKDDKTYANISTIIPWTQEKRDPENPTRFYSMKDHFENIPDGTPDWVSDIIKESQEWLSMQGDPEDDNQLPIGSYEEDDIPF